MENPGQERCAKAPVVALLLDEAVPHCLGNLLQLARVNTRLKMCVKEREREGERRGERERRGEKGRERERRGEKGDKYQ